MKKKKDVRRFGLVWNYDSLQDLWCAESKGFVIRAWLAQDNAWLWSVSSCRADENNCVWLRVCSRCYRKDTGAQRAAANVFKKLCENMTVPIETLLR